MSKTKRKLCATLNRLCKEKYNKYGAWIDGVYIPYEDMEEVCI